MKNLVFFGALLTAGCHGHAQGIGQACEFTEDCKNGLICANRACAAPKPAELPQNHEVDASLSVIAIDRERGIVADDEDAVSISVRLSTTTRGPAVGIAVTLHTDGKTKTDHFTPQITGTDEKGEAVFKLRSTKANLKTITVAVGDFEEMVLAQKPAVEFVAGPVDGAHTLVASTDARANGKAQAAVELQLADKFGNPVALAGQKLDLALPAGAALHFDVMSGVTSDKGAATFHATSTIVGRQWFKVMAPQGTASEPVRFTGAWESFNDESQLGILYAILVDPQDSDYLLIGSARGLFGTTDYKKFVPYDDEMMVGDPVYAVAANSNKEVYAGARRGVLHRELDGAWRPAGTSSPGSVRLIAFDPSNPDVVYAADYKFIYRKKADSWEQLNQEVLKSKFAPDEGGILAGFIPCTDGKIYAASSHGVFRYAEGSWVEIDDWHSDAQIEGLVGDSACNDVYLSTLDGIYRLSTSTKQKIDPGYSSIYFAAGMLFRADYNGVSRWGGGSWEQVSSNIGDNERLLALDPLDKRRIFSVGNNSGHVTRFGSKSEELWRHEDDLWLTGLSVMDTDPSTVVAINSKKLIKQRTMPRWENRPLALPKGDIKDTAFDRKGALVAALVCEYNFTGNQITPCKVHLIQGSDDKAIDPPVSDDWRYLSVDTSGNIYLGSLTSVYTRKAGASTWTSDTGLPPKVYSLKADFAGNVYLGSEDNKLYKRKSDGSWVVMTPNPPASILAFGFAPQDSATMYISTGRDLYKLSGSGWIQIATSGFPNPEYNGFELIAVDPHDVNTIYVGSRFVGVYYTTTAGAL